MKGIGLFYFRHIHTLTHNFVCLVSSQPSIPLLNSVCVGGADYMANGQPLRLRVCTSIMHLLQPPPQQHRFLSPRLAMRRQIHYLITTHTPFPPSLKCDLPQPFLGRRQSLAPGGPTDSRNSNNSHGVLLLLRWPRRILPHHRFHVRVRMRPVTRRHGAA
jgi:hypothetical protein